MNKNLENICRVCLNNGSRNIFEKSSNDSQFSIPAIGENVSSLDRLVEKLRYVTMLKVDECENLPKNMCDSCIIQLNVAYNLKKNAIQSDLKLRQYMIEFGINVTSYTTCSINTVSVIRPPAMILPSTTTSESVTITTAKSTTVAQQQQQPPPPPLSLPPRPHQPFPVMPVIIKEEPIDYEEMSDITVETNTFEDHIRNHRAESNGIQGTSSTSSASNKSTTPLPTHSMVSVNRTSLILSSKDSTDSEFISTYVRRPSVNSNQSKSVRTKPANKQVTTSKPSPKSKKSKPLTPSSRASANKKSPSPPQQRRNASKTNDEAASAKTNNPPSSKINREMRSLLDDSVNKTNIKPLHPKRVARQQDADSGRENDHKKSRSRSGVLPKPDYTSFFRNRTQKSDDSSLKRKTNSSNTRNLTKFGYSGVGRKRRTPMSNGNTTI